MKNRKKNPKTMKRPRKKQNFWLDPGAKQCKWF